MATSRKARSAKKGIAVDFSDTETQAVLPEGDYLLEVEDVEQKTSDNSGNDYLALTFKVAEGKFKGKKVWHNCSLQPQALFNLRGVLEALGFEVPQGSMELDPADLIGEKCGAAVAHEVYEGKKKARAVEFFSPDELDGDAEDEEDEEEAPVTTKPAKATKGKKAAPEPEEEDEEIDEEEDESEDEDDSEDEAELPTYEEVQEAEKDDLIELAAEHEVKLTLKQKKNVQLIKDAICEALGLEAPKPAPAAKAAAKKGKKAKTLAVGSKVSFVDDEGEVLKGIISDLDGDDVTVEVDDEEWELSLEDLTAL